MNFHVLTLFPEMIEQSAGTSILGRAVKNGHITLEATDIRDYTVNKHKKVDDYPYGGGAGMLMQAQPVYDACMAVKRKIGKEDTRVIYLTPQGNIFHQKMAEEFAKEEDLIFLCGHYEGIDERVLEEVVTDYVSIGDYVLTGGELPALVMIDSIARLVPGVLNNEMSAGTESFHNDLLEYPHYSRPEKWHDKTVPGILLSGAHFKVEEWRLEQSIMRTKERRPDLYEIYKKKQACAERLLKKDKLLYMDMAENLRRGNGSLIYDNNTGCIVYDYGADIYMTAAYDADTEEDIALFLKNSKKTVKEVVTHSQSQIDVLKQYYEIEEIRPCFQAVYTRRVALPVSSDIEIRILNEGYLDEIKKHYELISSDEYIQERLSKGEVAGAFVENKLAGFIGFHSEGSIGMLEVFPKYRGQKIALSLESYMINLHLSKGFTPYGNILEENEISIKLQEKLGLRISKEKIYWCIVANVKK